MNCTSSLGDQLLEVSSPQKCLSEFSWCLSRLFSLQSYVTSARLYHSRSPLMLSPSTLRLEALQQLLHLPVRILWILHLVPDGPLIAINLPVVTAGIGLVPIKVDDIIRDATAFLLAGKMRQAVCLVPARGEDVEGDLAADGVGEAGVREGGLEGGDHGGADVVLDVVGLVVVAFLDRGVAANGRDVDHAVAELDKGAALDGDVEVGNVVEDPVQVPVSRRVS
jgi:hypothetical protein